MIWNKLDKTIYTGDQYIYIYIYWYIYIYTHIYILEITFTYFLWNSHLLLNTMSISTFFSHDLYLYTCLFILQKLVLDIKGKKEANNSSWHLNASALIIINTVLHFSRVTGNSFIIITSTQRYFNRLSYSYTFHQNLQAKNN